MNEFPVQCSFSMMKLIKRENNMNKLPVQDNSFSMHIISGRRQDLFVSDRKRRPLFDEETGSYIQPSAFNGEATVSSFRNNPYDDGIYDRKSEI